MDFSQQADEAHLIWCQKKRDERMDADRRLRLDPGMCHRYLVRDGKHVFGRFEREAHGEYQWEVFKVLAMADSKEQLCIELDHIEALEDQEERRVAEWRIQRGIQKYQTESLGFWGRIKRFFKR